MSHNARQERLEKLLQEARSKQYKTADEVLNLIKRKHPTFSKVTMRDYLETILFIIRQGK